MKMLKHALLVAKIVVAGVAVVAVISIPARRLVPGLSVFELVALLICAGVVLILIAVCSLTFAQWILRKGGTDPQWFWFKGEPPGLEKLREEEREGQSREP